MPVDFSQTQEQFQSVKQAAVDALRQVFPINGKTRKMKLVRAWVDDTKDPTDYQSQIKTKMGENTWGVPVYAHLQLTDMNGKILDEAKKIRLINLPKPTERNSYIVGGNEYQVHNQLRLKPGVYTIRKQNGELKTQVNLAKGRNFEIKFNENKGVFYISKVGGGDANIPLYHVLLQTGITSQAISQAWGQKLAGMNELRSSPKDLDKLKTAFKLNSPEEINSYFSKKTELDPETTQETIGKSFDRVNGEMLLASSVKLLNVHLGKEKPVDRDSLEFKALHGIEDFIRERLEKNKHTLSFKVKRSIDSAQKTSISQIINPGTFNKVVESFFTQDDKSSTPDQTNPLEMISGTRKVTLMGAGGIGSEHAITDDMRQVHPSQFGLIDPVATPESSRVGVNLSFPIGAVKDGNQVKMKVLDKQGKEHLLSSTEAKSKRILLPDVQGNKGKGLYQGKVVEMTRAQADYVIPSSNNLFSTSTNLIPFLPSAQGNRATMAAKMMEQAISLKNREAPLVQTASPDGRANEAVIGEQSAIKSPVDGTIAKITESEIHIKGIRGSVTKVNLYNNFLLNRKSFLNHEVKVKVGDQVRQGQLLADSNYTKDGVLALGTNLKTAYIPFKGYNFDDGIVVSETGAKKLTSEHIYRKEFPISDLTIMGGSLFNKFYPNAISPENFKKLDNDGVIKKGEKVSYGDVYVAGLQRRDVSKSIGLISKVLSERPKDISLVWKNEDEGEVLDVIRTGKKVTVVIKTGEAAKIGDKLAGRHGNKGVITKIIPDSEMPTTSDGSPTDMLLNPMGIVSRINPSQLYDSALGKVVEKTGQGAKVVSNFTPGLNYNQYVKDEMKKAGVSDKEDLFDPKTGKKLGKVHVGTPHILKLFKQTSANYSVRKGGPGAGYDANMQPLKAGGEEGAKSLDLLTTYSMLSHGARHNLREMSSIKNTKNDEFWKAFKSGERLPPPDTSFAYDKFLGYLKGAGVDVKQEGTELSLAPFTDKQALEVSNGEIKKPQFYKAKDLTTIKDGFFDEKITGGFKGDKWAHMTLKEPIVNPPFENAVRKLTGLGKNFDKIIIGELFLDDKGNFNSKGEGATGGAAIETLLKKIDVDKELEDLRKKAETAKTSALDDINKRMRYLMALKKANVRPEEAYIRRVIPVVPPKFRPVYPLSDGNVTTSDVNPIYQNAAVLNTLMKAPVADMLPEAAKADIRKDMYTHIKGLSGLMDLNIKGKEREGFISQIKGGAKGQPKQGFFISKLLSKKQDYVGRGTIIPEPNLGIDEMAMPEQMAWGLFEPFVVRELKKFGKTPLEAIKEIKKKTPLAKKALDLVMKDRHVLMNRAPSLHKYSVMAFKPQITEGKALKIPPLVNKGFNADYDGDEQLTTVLTFVPEAGVSLLSEKMYASKIGDTDMTARFREIVGIKDENGEFFAFNLEDFPHTELLGSKDGKKGKIDFYRAPEGVKVLSYDRKTNDLAWKDVFGWSKHYQREIEIVSLRSGRQIVTDDDPRAVFGVAAGSIIPERFTPSEAEKKKVFVPLTCRCELTQMGGGVRKHNGYDLTEDFGHFIGSLVANGWLETCGKKFLRIGKEIFDYKGKDLEYTRSEGGDNAPGASKKWGFTSDGAASLLSPLVGHGARNKHLPPFFMSANKDFRYGLFAGLIDHDGSIAVVQAKGKKPQLMANYTTASIRLAQEVVWLARSLGIRGRISTVKTPQGDKCWQVFFSNIDIKKWGGRGLANEKKIEALSDDRVECTEESPTAAKNDIVPIHKETAEALRKNLEAPRNTPKEQQTMYATLSKAVQGGSMARVTAEKILSDFHPSLLENVPHMEEWSRVVKNKNITWDPVESFEVTGIFEDGYDLTVPGYETFTNIEGVVLSNTMTVHVPITDEANREAAKMKPSENLFQIGSQKLMIVPDQEAQVGLFYLSQTPEGRKKIESITGPEFKVGAVLNKRSASAFLTKLAKELPQQRYAQVVAKLKEAGEDYVYTTGFTTGVEDLVDFSKEREKALQLAKSLTKTKGAEEANKQVSELIEKMMASKLKGRNNPFYDMVESGGKGKSSQLRSIMMTPLFVADSKGKAVPVPISKSYSEGLDTSDYWLTMTGARKGMMDRATQTSEPGAFSKDVMSLVLNNVVSKTDCGTTDGVDLPLSSPDLHERYTANSQHGIPRNTLVDPLTISKAKKAGARTLKVRSTLKCKAERGVCSYCYGLDENGQLIEVGENVGVKSGQTVSEPLVQLAMNSFHTGGAAGTGTNVSGYARIDQLMKIPKNLTGAATLSTRDGRVNRITKSPAGGYDVVVDTATLHIAQGNAPLVKVGDQVKRGDAISSGPIKPQELAELKSMDAARDYLTNELQSTYSEQGVDINRKTFETVVKSLTDTSRVLNNPKNAPFIVGDVVSLAAIENYNRNLIKEQSVEDAEGYTLAKDYGPLKKGYELTRRDLNTLKALGVKTVLVEREEIKHQPFIKGMTEHSLLRKDWMGALGYRNLQKALTEGASQGWQTDVSGYHPVPALAYGVTFGKGKDGKY